MLFHPSFRFSREHRLIFEKDAPAAAPTAEDTVPKVELSPQQQQAKEVVDALKEKLKTTPKNNLNALNKLAALKFDEAETDETKFQETYHSALEKAANAYFKTLEGTDEEKAQKVNELFQSAGAPDVRLEGGVLQMAPSSPEKKERVLTPEEQAMIDTAFSTHPQLRAAAERLITTLTPDSPELETARGFFEAFNAKSPAQKKAILTDNRAFQQFLGELPADQKEFVSKLRVTMQETGKELSDEEMQDTVEKAQNFLKEKKFNYATATEMQKNLMLAQLQMLGIDVSGGETILKDPSKLQALNGSPMERGFNKILGMISYILLSIQQMKERIKPSEKKTDTPAGDKDKKGPEASSPEKEAMRQKLKEQMKDSTGDTLKTEKENKRTTLQKEIKALDKEVNDLKGKDDDDSKRSLEKKSDELKEKKQEEAQLGQEIAVLQEMQTATDGQRKILNAGREALISYLERGDALYRVPNAAKIRDAFKKVSFVTNDRFELALRDETGGQVDRNVLAELSGAITFRMNTDVDYLAIDDQGVLKRPEGLQAVLRQLLDGFKSDVKADEPPAAPAVPPAPPATPTP